MTAQDFFRLIHPIFAIILVYPLIGIATYFAWLTRQRRLKINSEEKSKIPPLVGKDHLNIGKLLSGAVVGITLLGLLHPITKNILSTNLWEKDSFKVIFLALIFIFTIASLGFLYRARVKIWRIIFATLTGMGLIILGLQDGVFRRTNEWYWSHYYYGIVATLLMIFSLAIVPEIYQDKSNKWRNLHIILNCLALLLFVGQGITGTRDLFEIGLYTPPPG